jgi:hypothetical protein
MEDTGPFAIGEKVLVPHTDKYYEAKVLKTEYRDDKMWYYFLHYTGRLRLLPRACHARCPWPDGSRLEMW